MPIRVTIDFTEELDHVTVKEVVSGKIHIDDERIAKGPRPLTIDDNQGIGRVNISWSKLGEKESHRQLELRSGEKYKFPDS
ncbi:hypothetical protein [Sinorhizobium meliloti]|uniref:hypothetical protein n=1 Tax=Rhizobium meliloti TaxID=382 RepID=UPI0018F372F9|nr:hypothetical protein [Sinorhizobium meliloti]